MTHLVGGAGSLWASEPAQQRLLAHHEGWMKSDQETVFCRIWVPVL